VNLYARRTTRSFLFAAAVCTLDSGPGPRKKVYEEQQFRTH
jgi:hypothetical protein